ncbi:MAG: hemerythrin domain-containing protein [Acidobacteriota bacterium]
MDWIVEWQETYHRPHFDRWHFPGSPKRQYEFRTDIWDRVIRGGISKIALGVLLGLYDWRYEVLAVVEHGNYLRRTYGVEPHALGIPRLKPARGVLASQKASRFAVSDDDFRFIVSLYRLAFPSSRLFFNTREPYEFNLSMVSGGDLFTVDCETLPGGYLRRHLPGQFSIHGYPPRREVVSALKGLNLDIDYLAEETESPVVVSGLSGEEDFDPECWAEEHQAIRLRLGEWEDTLSALPSALREEHGEHVPGVEPLRAILQYFKTTVMEHCRKEESVFLPALSEETEARRSLRQFRDYHERLAIDLDKFDRQLISYSLSGDPGVLRLVGSRMIQEMREHLDAEEEFQKRWAQAAVRLYDGSVGN